MLAHVRNGQVITTYPVADGWVILANGDRVSPPVAGYVRGNDKILNVEIEEIDNSTGERAGSNTEWIVQTDKVIRRTTITDLPSEVPQVVSMAQLRLALIDSGQLSGFDTALKALPVNQKEKVLAVWEYAPTVHRAGKFVAMLMAKFNITKQQMDNVFTAAAAIEE